jgi:hypothetical protein
VVELKWNQSADGAISQIKEKQYIMAFRNKIGSDPVYDHCGRILAVGIGYDKNMKEHSCKVEVLWDAID